MNHKTNQKNDQNEQSHAAAEFTSPAQNSIYQFVDNRPEVKTQRNLQSLANNSSKVTEQKVYQKMANDQVKSEGIFQRKTAASSDISTESTEKPNNTGLPDNLKHGMESLSGISLNDVKVHHNSSKPAQLQAKAYAQGTDIHLGAGEEKHLPHEAWHVVQQKQGRVKPTMQMKNNVEINDDSSLEKEADVMGDKALQQNSESDNFTLHSTQTRNPTVQFMKTTKKDDNNPEIAEEDSSSIEIDISSSEENTASSDEDSGKADDANSTVDNNPENAEEDSSSIEIDISSSEENAASADEDSGKADDANSSVDNNPENAEEDSDNESSNSESQKESASSSDNSKAKEDKEDGESSSSSLIVDLSDSVSNEQGVILPAPILAEDESSESVDQEYFTYGNSSKKTVGKFIFDIRNPTITDNNKPAVLAALRLIIDKQKVRINDKLETRAATGQEIAVATETYKKLTKSKSMNTTLLDLLVQEANSKDFINSNNKHEKVYQLIDYLTPIATAGDLDEEHLPEADIKLRDKLIKMFEDPELSKAIKGIVRQGGNHEQLITSITPDIMLKQLQGELPAKINSSGHKITALSIQEETLVPTHEIILKSTEEDSTGKKLQCHHPTSKELIAYMDKDGELHQSVGSGVGGSVDFHLGDEGLVSARAASSLDDIALNILKINRDHLATYNDIMGIPATERGNQIYTTEGHGELHFNNQKELEIIALYVEVRRARVLDAIIDLEQKELAGKSNRTPGRKPAGRRGHSFGIVNAEMLKRSKKTKKKNDKGKEDVDG